VDDFSRTCAAGACRTFDEKDQRPGIGAADAFTAWSGTCHSSLENASTARAEYSPSEGWRPSLPVVSSSRVGCSQLPLPTAVLEGVRYWREQQAFQPRIPASPAPHPARAPASSRPLPPVAGHSSGSLPMVSPKVTTCVCGPITAGLLASWLSAHVITRPKQERSRPLDRHGVQSMKRARQKKPRDWRTIRGAPNHKPCQYIRGQSGMAIGAAD
jgi:hypothetical protein